jgi:hypothetical protein
VIPRRFAARDLLKRVSSRTRSIVARSIAPRSTSPFGHALEDVAELPDVPGPVVAEEPDARDRRDARRWAPERATEIGEEALGERQDVVGTPRRGGVRISKTETR